MADTENYITKEGLEKIKAELEELKTVRRRELAEKLQRAIAEGDLSENAEYQEAKEEQAFLEGRIVELEELTSTAVVIDSKKGGGTVKIGSTVMVERAKKGSKKKMIVTIVGSEETDPNEGKISHVSPVGSALLGKRPGDCMDITTPGGKTTWCIISVK